MSLTSGNHLDRRLDLVSGQNPQLDARLRELGDAVGGALLQLVLDRSSADDLQIPLDRRRGLGHQRLSVHARPGRGLGRAPLFAKRV